MVGIALLLSRLVYVWKTTHLVMVSYLYYRVSFEPLVFW